MIDSPQDSFYPCYGSGSGYLGPEPVPDLYTSLKNYYFVCVEKYEYLTFIYLLLVLAGVLNVRFVLNILAAFKG
jgi:hypothetical protein